MIASSEQSNHDHTISSGSSGSHEQAKVAECGIIIGALDDLSFAIESLDEALGNMVAKMHPVLREGYSQQVSENKDGEEDVGASALYKDITMNANKIYRIRDLVVEIKGRVEL